jgi:NADH-quinone oxidoreductase subunit L
MELIAVFAPLVGFLIAFLFGKQIGEKGAQFVTCSGLILAALCSCALFYFVAIGHEPRTINLGTWIAAGTFNVNWALRIDQLTVVMMCVINIVSSCVHVYSVGYMSHDDNKARFMAYLSLFTFAMLMLVTADNLVQLFFGWEGVGLASYLLIGFWNYKESANAAAVKAFVVNRVGDFGLALGIFAAFVVFGSVQFDAIFAQAPEKVAETFNFLGYEVHAITLVCLLLFVGACGKSAQLGLHTWLPDAMEGPTPVSALIHAATMVTAGVFLVARMSPLFEYAPDARNVVCFVGATTAFVAATIGLTQFDIKRVIAYSTMSQLGYMFFALGVSAYSAAMFHLMTHAFFKALLFLGAGSVIHAMSGEQDMRKMGGIWKLIPVTYVLMWVGSLALAGVPFFAGFYSKDLILESAFAAHSQIGLYAFAMGIAAAIMTAFYSWRLIIMTFHGKPRADHHTMEHVHESPGIMIGPLLVLATGALLAGSVFAGSFGDGKAEFFGESLKVLEANDTVAAAHHAPGWVKLLPIVCGILGIGFAYVVYTLRVGLADKIVRTFKPLHTLFFNKWFFDEIYNAVFVRNAYRLGRVFWQVGDKAIIDGLGPDGISASSRAFGGVLSRFQTGYMFHYAFVMMIGLIGLVSWFVWGRFHG